MDWIWQNVRLAAHQFRYESQTENKASHIVEPFPRITESFESGDGEEFS